MPKTTKKSKIEKKIEKAFKDIVDGTSPYYNPPQYNPPPARCGCCHCQCRCNKGNDYYPYRDPFSYPYQIFC